MSTFIDLAQRVSDRYSMSRELSIYAVGLMAGHDHDSITPNRITDEQAERLWRNFVTDFDRLAKEDQE